MQEYKVLWSESCGADWPCSTFIGNKCEPVLNVMKKKRWEQTKCVVIIISKSFPVFS